MVNTNPNRNPNKNAWNSKMKNVTSELKSTLNRRRNNLQKGEQIYEAVGKETTRNANANRAYMNRLRRGSNTPENLIRKAAMTKKNNRVPIGKYVKTTGLNSDTKSLSCTKTSPGQYICQSGAGRATRRRSVRGRKQ
jgi:hypothetical protein